MAAIVSVSTYRHFTHDTTTSDDDVTTAIADGIEVVEEILRRPLESKERTEDVYIEWRGNAPYGGYMYPLATPITAVPSGYSILGDAIVLGSATLTVGDLPGPFFDYENINDARSIMSITYTGGWTADTLPMSLTRAICEAAFGLTRPFNSSVPIGATSVKVGDVAVSYGANGAMNSAQGSVLTISTIRSLKKYGRRYV